MEKEKKKILIVGACSGTYTLAQKMSKQQDMAEVFVAPGNSAMKDFCTVVDIRASNVDELLEFALENAIDITVVFSEDAIGQDIATLFQKNNQMIFAPTQASASICLSKSAGKKFMYKNRIPCPKFGIFDKMSMAVDYAQKSNMPIVVKTDSHQPINNVLVCNSFQIAKKFIEELFDSDEKKVVIEDYVLGHEFSFYVITDGYHALPIGTSANYKHELDGNGGNITEGMGCFSPDYKVSRELEYKILRQIIYPAINSLAHQQTPYVGILGVDLILDSNGKLCVIEFNPFLKSPDCESILANINEDLYQLFQACVIGSFADDYEKIDIDDNYSASCVLLSRKAESIIEGLDDLDDETKVAHFNTFKNKYLEYETMQGRALTLTTTARTLSRALEKLYDEVSAISYDGIKYRKDIGKLY